MIKRILVAAAMLTVGGVASAQVQVPYAFTPGEPAKASEVNADFAFLASNVPQVYWWQAQIGTNWDVVVTATTKVGPANPPWDIPVGTLNLPAGAYVVSAKLSVYNTNGITGGNGFLCRLQNSADANSNRDYSAVDLGGGEKVLFLQVPIVASAAATVSLDCHIYGTAGDGASFVSADYWGAHILATKVAAVTAQ